MAKPTFIEPPAGQALAGSWPNAAQTASETLQCYDDYLRWLERVLAGNLASASSSAKAATLHPGRTGADTSADTGSEPANTAGAGASNRFAPATNPGQRLRPFDGAPEMLVLPTGQVQLGAHASDPAAEPSERPPRTVALTRPIAIGIAPVTFGQWDACLADDGTRHRPDDATWGRGQQPVMNLSWHDAEEYCAWLTRKTGLRWRLPSEAEWTHACWAGVPQAHRYPWGDDPGHRQLRHHAWFAENANLRTHPVGQLQPNAWGLVDMLGNLAQWVADAWHPDLSRLPGDGSAYQSPALQASRVIKGGSWLESARTVRPAARDHFHPDHRSYRVGFRVVVELD